MPNHSMLFLKLLPALLPLSALAAQEPRWLAGDHHVHSIYSAKFRPDPAAPDNLPEPILGGDSRHTTLRNAQMARQHGLDWMVTTDHGGPGHSQIAYDRAWPDIVAARRAMPDLVLFYGMEFDVPGGEHASFILPIEPGERAALRRIEGGFGKREPWPADPSRSTKPRMIEALRAMAALPAPPVLIANHPSRTATGLGAWGLHSPAEYRRWQQTAPDVVVGMEGAPGHQAARPKPGLDTAHGSRGLYGGYPTMGGFDQMTAVLGGAWDAMLGQGLRWTITATSDSHGHWREGGADFWPGEYAKTWVFAERNSASILDGLRRGRVFVATGGLIERLDVGVRAGGGSAAMGDKLAVAPGAPMTVTIRFRPAQAANADGAVPRVDHVDLIAGERAGAAGDHNPTTRVVRRFAADEWRRDGADWVIEHRMIAPSRPAYLRVRGTNTVQAEPAPDTPGESPWADLWFYSNPVYLGE
ncbi:phosphoesterase [Sphingomonas sp.]|uniref:phosphoesterase n=1 Tax=Sphingomonas sp. TaxID=28214 RepID=UPI002B7E360D|nr:phosphoesterase [Sphingomonas sp.]HTG38414.1 phosphoesterase [Sphingomonas sp.]